MTSCLTGGGKVSSPADEAASQLIFLGLMAHADKILSVPRPLTPWSSLVLPVPYWSSAVAAHAHTHTCNQAAT